MIRSDDLIALFQLMYAERWTYEWGAARRGCVDCSGAFVYAFRQLGGSIYHGSNTIARKYVGAFQKDPRPGFAAFKWKKTDTAKYPDGRGDFYHIGLVDADGEHVLNAKGTKAGFCRDKADGWHSFAPLIGVEYSGTTEQGGGQQVIYSAIVTTDGGRLNIRKEPGVKSEIVGSLLNGEKVDIIEEKNGWGKLGDSIEGWVSLNYLRPIEEGPQDLTSSDAADAAPPSPEGKAYGVFIPCDNEEEARRYAGNVKGALVLRIDKPPDSEV